jgi:hypothetical protein
VQGFHINLDVLERGYMVCVEWMKWKDFERLVMPSLQLRLHDHGWPYCLWHVKMGGDFQTNS